MLKQVIHAVFFYNNKRKIGVFFLVLAFIGCVKNAGNTFSQEAILVESTDNVKKVAYLTFDDGPSMMTEVVLDTLKAERVTATFFIIGKQVTEDKVPVLKRMVEEGNLIGIHTYTHNYKEIYASADAYVDDAKRTAERIYEVTQIAPIYYRFPWGSANCYVSPICDDIINQMDKMGYVYYDWNVSADDSIGNPAKQKILANIRKDYRRYNEPVILLHDSSINENTVEILPEIIHELKEAGYEFSTVDKRSKPCQY
ncbi:MAG: polysaccharide deacetylase family protein [Velocimicrobium sp.]